MSTEPTTHGQTDHEQTGGQTGVDPAGIGPTGTQQVDTAQVDSEQVDTAQVDTQHGETDAPDSAGADTDVDTPGASSTESEPTGSTPETDGPDNESAALARGGTSPRGARHEHLEHEGEIAADFLETLLDIADLDGDLEVDVEGDRAAVAIVDSEDGPAPKTLVGRDGAVLEALQELTRLAVQAETGDRSRLMLDVAGHRAGRRAQLVELARTTTQQVKESGERAELEPMSAFERKVVHDEVLAAGLVSESEGTEPNRYVVILPAG